MQSYSHARRNTFNSSIGQTPCLDVTSHVQIKVFYKMAVRKLKVSRLSNWARCQLLNRPGCISVNRSPARSRVHGVLCAVVNAKLNTIGQSLFISCT